MADHLKPFQFQKGMETIGGRKVGTRNKLSDAFLKDLSAEWARSGPACLKILAVENPAMLAGLVAKVIPQAFDADAPAVLRIVTGVVRAGERYEDLEHLRSGPPLARTPQIPAANIVALPKADRSDTED